MWTLDLETCTTKKYYNKVNDIEYIRKKFDIDESEEYARAYLAVVYSKTKKGNEKVGQFYSLLDLKRWFEGLHGYHEFYIHNLTFDWSFIVYYMEEYVTKQLISDFGSIYTIECKINDTILVFKDSVKILPMTLKKIGENIVKTELKGDIEHNHNFYEPPTKEEIDYCIQDCRVLYKAIQIAKQENITALTLGSSALKMYKKMTPNFKELFPTIPLELDLRLRESYRGGICYVKEKYCEKGDVYDINSLYPHIMSKFKLPCGVIKLENDVNEFDYKKHFIIRFHAEFKVRRGFLPFLQLKKEQDFKKNDYVEDSRGIRTLCLTSVDFNNFIKHYDILYYKKIELYTFEDQKVLFKDYVKYWNSIKEESKENKNDSLYVISKLFSNSLSGKFGMRRLLSKNFLGYSKDKKTYKVYNGEYEENDGVYLPVVAFITAFARDILLSTIQKDYKNFLYCDTDSVHVNKNFKFPKDLVHNSKLGFWKHEYSFTKAKYLRQKCYIERKENGKNHIASSGTNTKDIERRLRRKIKFDEWEEGQQFPTLKSKKITGGTKLYETVFTL